MKDLIFQIIIQPEPSHDSLYITNNILLRTHNTGITAYELEKNANKCANIFSIGKVYRNDEDDATHSHQFTQAWLCKCRTAS